jgi:hypothetical protein
MEDIRRKNYRLFYFFAGFLLLTISLELVNAGSYSLATVAGDAIFFILFALLAFYSKKDFDLFGNLGAILLLIFVLFYAWRSYEWMTHENLFDEDPDAWKYLGDSRHLLAKIFMVSHSLKTLCGIFGLMLQVTLFSNPPE